jgi:acetate kinase
MQDSTILVINCGSSSVKFSLINPNTRALTLSGIAENLMHDNAIITIKYQHQRYTEKLTAPYDHQVALDTLGEFLTKHQLTETVQAIGHRVVHGGEYYADPVIIDDKVKQVIKQLAKIAPLHNPANLIGIEATEKRFPKLKQVAVFDTAFHQTMPKSHYLYPIPYALYEQHAIRKYGFHGTSHYYVAQQAALFLQKPSSQCHLITAHLGNGCSVTAIKHGQSVDSSMGFTPLEGVMMGTRSGSIDPGIIMHLQQQLGYSCEQVDKLLNKQSGLLGISQLTNDCRELEQAMNNGNEQAALALTMFCHRVAKSIAALSVNLPQLDALVFTGGIGENSSFVREKICEQLALLNIKLDPVTNQHAKTANVRNVAPQQQIPILVIATDEEGVIAQQTAQLLGV